MLNIYSDDLIPELITLRDRTIPDNVIAITHTYNCIPGVYKTPSLQDALRCVELHPEQVKVIIIGQDPYPTYGAATGLAFSINKQVGPKGAGKSIYNMAVEIYRCIGYDVPENISGNLDHWQQQGVMLLNSALSTGVGEVGSHIGYWRSCVRGIVFDYIQSNRNIVVLCLGAKARNLVKNMDIDKKKILYKQHPNARNCNIQGSDVFLKVNELIRGHAIDWRLHEEASNALV